jgi:hypothetical protein
MKNNQTRKISADTHEMRLLRIPGYIGALFVKVQKKQARKKGAIQPSDRMKINCCRILQEHHELQSCHTQTDARLESLKHNKSLH